MLRKTLSIFLTALLVVLILSVVAFAATVNLDLNTGIASPGESLTVSGAADADTWVSLKIFDGAGKIVFYDAVKSDSDANYSFTCKVPSVESGFLKVVAGYGRNVATKDLAVISDHWARENFKQLVASKAIGGYPDGTFKLDNNITRAEFSTVLVKAFELESEEGTVFNDTADHWAKDVIATAAAHGIVSGYSETAFGPNDNITREQLAVMVSKAAQLPKAIGDFAFGDSGKVADWAKQAVAAAVEEGIISGYPDNTFRPQDQATRAEAATMIVNALQ
ncbi:MAG: S-layer homology domain-containing protein [Firmicutes bacterium]|nr:S-layer homology domain-containing protein [Bacillota bacterium]